MIEMIWPSLSLSLSLSLSKILLEILKFRFSLHMVSKMTEPQPIPEKFYWKF